MKWIVRIVGASILAQCGLIVLNSLPYFSSRMNLAFLVEKGELAYDPTWRWCFLGHVLGGIVCLITAPFLFWNGLLRRAPRLHRVLGRVYGAIVLGCAAPAGLYLALFAKGGPAGKAGFLVLGLLWWGATARGVQAIVSRRVAEHRRWMVRSYALALSAVFFRLFHVSFYVVGMADEPNYILSLWLSLAASLVAGEAVVRRSPSDAAIPSLKGGVS
jgi:uncharacterized membrane protein